MQETHEYAVGIDIGTTTIRCVVGHIDTASGTPTIVGVGQSPNSGMRKGVVVNLAGPAKAIDDALGEAERMSGYQVDEATISINGSHIMSTRADGMIAVGGADHEIILEDIDRIEEVSTTGKIPANREIIEIVPHSYSLDGQENIKDPIGMTGTRLEIKANVVSVLEPHFVNLQKAAEMAKVSPHAIIPAGIAAAKAVLSEQQLENGVALIDIGGATSNVAVFEEGDLQYIAVIPVGGVNITNDLAIGLKTDPEIAEKVKISHVNLNNRSEKDYIQIKHNKESYDFDSKDIEEIVEARLDEIFDAISQELKKAGCDGSLPNGVVLTGGTANLKGLDDFAKQKLGVAARIGKASGYAGVADHIEEPQFASVIGLMLSDLQSDNNTNHQSKSNNKKKVKAVSGFLKNFFSRFKA